MTIFFDCQKKEKYMNNDVENKYNSHAKFMADIALAVLN